MQKPELTIDQAYDLYLNTFNILDQENCPDMLIDTPRGVEVSEDFVLYCREHEYL